MRKRHVIMAIGLIFLLLSTPVQAVPAKEGAQKVADSINAFAVDLYGKLSASDDNLFFSPYSIATALGMTYLGARGSTAEEMEKTLHFSQPPAELHESLGSLICELNSAGKSGSFIMVTANRLWGQKGHSFLKSFLTDSEKYYGSGLSEVDFKKEAEKTRVIINKWIEKQTQEKIKDLIPAGVIDASTELVLTNAVYFKSAWMTPFKENATMVRPFYITPSKKVDVNMMAGTINSIYGKKEGLAVVEIPYVNSDFSMMIVLPDKKNGLKEIEKNLTAEKLRQYTSGLSPSEVRLCLPKFRISGPLLRLKPILKALGMSAPFNGADFSGIDGTKTLFIGDVLHKAFVDVNEQGTEAAAATATVMMRGCSVGKDMPEFRADHPFLYTIRHRRSGVTLFMGCLKTPPSK